MHLTFSSTCWKRNILWYCPTAYRKMKVEHGMIGAYHWLETCYNWDGLCYVCFSLFTRTCTKYFFVNRVNKKVENIKLSLSKQVNNMVELDKPYLFKILKVSNPGKHPSIHFVLWLPGVRNFLTLDKKG